MKSKQSQRILDLLSKPFVPSEYFQTNERIFVGNSLSALLKKDPAYQITNFGLGYLELAFRAESKIFDKEVLKIFSQKYPMSLAAVTFLDVALHIERRLSKDPWSCEVIYLTKPMETLKALSIETRSVDGRLEINIFNLNKSVGEKDSPWREGTEFLIKNRSMWK